MVLSIVEYITAFSPFLYTTRPSKYYVYKSLFGFPLSDGGAFFVKFYAIYLNRLNDYSIKVCQKFPKNVILCTKYKSTHNSEMYL